MEVLVWRCGLGSPHPGLFRSWPVPRRPAPGSPALATTTRAVARRQQTFAGAVQRRRRWEIDVLDPGGFGVFISSRSRSMDHRSRRRAVSATAS
jgi:hypothetical protein